MADSEAVRSQRKRRHAAGDHGMCRPERCREAGRTLVPVLPAGEINPVAELEALVRRLIAISEADPANTAVARELRETLRALPPPLGELDPVEKLQAEVAVIRALHTPANVAPIRGGDGHG
jgi:hypothetical protein